MDTYMGCGAGMNTDLCTVDTDTCVYDDENLLVYQKLILHDYSLWLVQYMLMVQPVL
ncbi:hypothetical protein D3C79_1049020 [compost metagenome]